MSDPTVHEYRALRAAFGLFALAAVGGVLFRFTVAYGWSTGIDPVNLRHAHSHLMYFGWVTPALFALSGAAAGRPVPPRLLAWTLGLALVTGTAFLPWGYGPTAIGPAKIPITIILSALCMVAWYAWAAWYRSARAGIERSSRTLWDAAALFLVASTLGAWSVAAAVPFGGASAPVKAAMAHLFLQYFAEGWFILGLLGAAWLRLEGRTVVPAWALGLMVAGVAGGFLLSIPGAFLPDATRFLGRVSGLAHGAGTVGLAWTWWRHAGPADRSAWGIPILFLAAKGATQAGAVLVPGIWWADLLPVRVLYLHVLLLGFVTPAVAASCLRRSWLVAFQLAVVAAVVALVPLTNLWPWAPAGAWSLGAAAWLSLAPPVVVLAALAFAGTAFSWARDRGRVPM